LAIGLLKGISCVLLHYNAGLLLNDQGFSFAYNGLDTIIYHWLQFLLIKATIIN